METSASGVAALLQSIADGAGLSPALPESIDEPPPLPAQPVSQLGDRWQLGNHQLLCGDATDGDAIRQLFSDAKAGWMWTDPPSGVAYQGRAAEALTIENDTPKQLALLLRQAFASADTVLGEGAAIYLCHPAGPLSLTFSAAFIGAGWHLPQTVIWVRCQLVLCHADYHYRHEPIYYGWKGTNRAWHAGRDQDSIFAVERPKHSPEHPTTKPVELVIAQLRNSSLPGELSYDPFASSGTTLLAAEALGRRCFAVELDPRYVDVCIERWQALTGASAILADDGHSHEEIKEERRSR